MQTINMQETNKKIKIITKYEIPINLRFKQSLRLFLNIKKKTIIAPKIMLQLIAIIGK
jgi:hypothetical protein